MAKLRDKNVFILGQTQQYPSAWLLPRTDEKCLQSAKTARFLYQLQRCVYLQNVASAGAAQPTRCAVIGNLALFNIAANVQQITIVIHKELTDIMDPFELDKQFQINSSQDDNYYHEYCRLLLANMALTSQMKQLIDDKNELAARLRKYEDEEFSQSERTNDKLKRLRRNADEIERYYKCSVKVCGKSYGSEGSLNQHYKLKHPEIYVSLPNVQSHSGTAREEPDENMRDRDNRRSVATKYK